MILAFGPFRLDDRSLELWRDGRRVPIRPQPCRLLALLASRAGELVTRQELVAALWDDGVHVRFDLGLSSCLKQARAALGDDAERPTWIATLPRRGYRFLRSVSQQDGRHAHRTRRLLVLPVRALPADGPAAALAAALGDEIEIHVSRMQGSGIAVLAASAMPDIERPSLHALRDADVDLVLDCRLQWSAPALRVTAQLIDVADRTVVWADIEDVTLHAADDQMAAQRRTAHALARGVSAALAARGEPQRLAG